MNLNELDELDKKEQPVKAEYFSSRNEIRIKGLKGFRYYSILSRYEPNYKTTDYYLVLSKDKIPKVRNPIRKDGYGNYRITPNFTIDKDAIIELVESENTKPDGYNYSVYRIDIV